MIKKLIYKNWKILVVILIFVISFFIFNNKKTEPIKVKNNNEISQTQTTDWLDRTYDPENTRKEFESSSEKTLTSTGWMKPKNPYSISSGNKNLKIVLKKDYIVPSSLKSNLEKFNLSLNQSQHLIDFNYAPRSVVYFDVTGDGKSETVITSVGVGCGRCVDFYISIFTDKGIFDMKVNEGAIVPRQDGNGFYLTDYFWGKENSTVKISKYVLEQNQFKEILRKTLTLISKK